LLERYRPAAPGRGCQQTAVRWRQRSSRQARRPQSRPHWGDGNGTLFFAGEAMLQAFARRRSRSRAQARAPPSSVKAEACGKRRRIPHRIPDTRPHVPQVREQRRRRDIRRSGPESSENRRKRNRVSYSSHQWFQGAAQFAHSAKNTVFSGVFADAESGPDLFDREVLIVAENEGRSLHDRKLVHRFFDVVADLPAISKLVSRRVRGSDIGEPSGAIVAALAIDETAARAHQIERIISCNAIEPG